MDKGTQQRAMKGMAWVGIEKIFIHVVRFGFGILMARLLFPEDYGIVGILYLYLNVSTVFIYSGFMAALTQKKDRTEADYATVFFFNLAVSLLFYGGLYVAAPWIAAFYRIPLLTEVTRVVALGLPLGALCGVHRTRLAILLNFKTQTLITVVALMFSSVLGLVLAYLGYGVWALVWLGLSRQLITTILYWGITRWHPQVTFSIASFKRFFSYGWKHLCSSLIHQVYAEINTLIIGRKFSAVDVGYYTRANGYAALPTGVLTASVVRVNFPVLAQLQDDHEKLLGAYRQLLRSPIYLLAPLLFGFGVLAKPLIVCMIGAKWLPCVPYLQVLCFGALFHLLTNVNLNLLYVKGRTDGVLKLELIKKPLAFAILFAMIPFGIFWMCVGKAVYDFLAFSFNCYYTKKLLNYGWWAQMKEILPILLNASVMAVGVYCALLGVASMGLQLAIGIPVGVVLYLMGSVVLKDASFFALWHRLKQALNARRRA